METQIDKCLTKMTVMHHDNKGLWGSGGGSGSACVCVRGGGTIGITLGSVERGTLLTA